MDNLVYKPVYKWTCHMLQGLILAIRGLILGPELIFKNLYYKNLTRARGALVTGCGQLSKKVNFDHVKFRLCQFLALPTISRVKNYHTGVRQSQNVIQLNFSHDTSHDVSQCDTVKFL